jgi:hypothetical protein
MSALVGRRGGGGRGRRGGGRRFFGGGGGWGWGWPAYPVAWPYGYPSPYGYPPTDPSVGDGGGSSVGASAAAVLAPGADGVSCQMSLGSDLRLYVSVVVDGQTHETSVDLTDLLCRIAEGVARRTGGAATEGAARDMAARTERVVRSAGELVVGALVDRHVATVSAGFWDSLGSGALTAYRTVSTPVTWFHKKVNQTIRDNPALKQIVVTAASAVATAYGGPAAGAAAAQFAPSIIDSSAETGGDPTMLFESGKKKAADASGGDPKVAVAISHAEKAITQTMAVAALSQLADDAAHGDPEAIRQVEELRGRAQAGDQPSIRAMAVIAEAQRVSAAGPSPGRA